MSITDLENRLRKAAISAAPPRAITENILQQLPPHAPAHAEAQPGAGGGRAALNGRRAWAAAFAAVSGIAAAVVIALLLMGNDARLALAQVQAAMEGQKWVHQRSDAGQIKELWINLQTGEFFALRFDGDAVYNNREKNMRLWYSKQGGVIHEDVPAVYPEGRGPPKWTARTAWAELVTPYERAADKPLPGGGAAVETNEDTLDGKKTVRFDIYNVDATGKRFLDAQLWADPSTRLPIRMKTRLQLSERQESGKEWSTGEFDFPATGPADLFALGVPKDIPIRRMVLRAPVDVQPILDGIAKHHDAFLKQYRAVVWEFFETNPKSFNAVDTIWRDGDKLRNEHHLPDVQALRRVWPTPLTGEVLFAWTVTHPPTHVNVAVDDKGYSWSRLSANAVPQVQVFNLPRGTMSYFAKQFWPENIQWPTRRLGANFQKLPANDAAPGCEGIRWDTGGNQRSDFYIDPEKDYLCLLQIDWTREQNGEWKKTAETTLSDLKRIEDHFVATRQKTHHYPNQVHGTGEETSIKTIWLTPLKPEDFPAKTFDSTPLTTGATVN